MKLTDLNSFEKVGKNRGKKGQKGGVDRVGEERRGEKWVDGV